MFQKSRTQLEISDAAVEKIVELSEGHPHFLHQIGYASFNATKSNTIDAQDVLDATFSDRGALDTIGDIYFRDIFESDGTTDTEREILKSLSEYVEGYKSTAELALELDLKESEVRGLVRGLNKKGLARFDSFSGEIHLIHKCFAYWLQSQHWWVDQNRKR